MKRILSLILLLSMLLVGMAACKNDDTVELTTEELIEERIQTFLTAYNTGDMSAVLECLDAKTRNAFQAMLNLLGGLAGSAAGFDIDLSDLFSLGVSTTSGDFMHLEIGDIRVIDERNAVAITTMSMPGGMNQMTIYFVMVYENDGWYIHDMTDRRPVALDSVEATTGSTGESGGKFVGQYELVDISGRMTYNGQTIELEEGLYEYYRIILNEDGTAEIKSKGANTNAKVAQEGTWEWDEEDEVLKLKSKPEGSSVSIIEEMEWEDGVIIYTAEQEGDGFSISFTIVLEKADSFGIPAKVPSVAKTALENARYEVVFYDDKNILSYFGIDGLTAYLVGSKGDDEAVIVWYFEDADAADAAWEDLEEEFKEMSEDAEEEGVKITYKKFGSMIWCGTKDAIKAAK